MAQKMTGALVFDERTDRYDIRFDLNSYYGGLHCGECFDVFVRGKWKPTRIEYGDNWYLVGIRAEDLNGCGCVSDRRPIKKRRTRQIAGRSKCKRYSLHQDRES